MAREMDRLIGVTLGKASDDIDDGKGAVAIQNLMLPQEAKKQP